MTVMQATRNRRSVRAYDGRPIPADVARDMQDALRLAPSACNFQPWRFVWVTDAELKHKLAVAAKGQSFIAEAPVVVVGCGLPGDAYKHMGGSGNSAEIDVTIALDHLTLAAADAGLGTCWIGAFSEAQARTALNVPAGIKVVAMTPLGYPKTPDLIAPVDPGKRRGPDEVLVQERFA